MRQEELQKQANKCIKGWAKLFFKYKVIYKLHGQEMKIVYELHKTRFGKWLLKDA